MRRGLSFLRPTMDAPKSYYQDRPVSFFQNSRVYFLAFIAYWYLFSSFVVTATHLLKGNRTLWIRHWYWWRPRHSRWFRGGLWLQGRPEKVRRDLLQHRFRPPSRCLLRLPHLGSPLRCHRPSLFSPRLVPPLLGRCRTTNRCLSRATLLHLRRPCRRRSRHRRYLGSRSGLCLRMCSQGNSR
jgi:hypothetical protein